MHRQPRSGAPELSPRTASGAARTPSICSSSPVRANQTDTAPLYQAPADAPPRSHREPTRAGTGRPALALALGSAWARGRGHRTGDAAIHRGTNMGKHTVMVRHLEVNWERCGGVGRA